MENVDSIDAIKLIKDDVNPFHKYSSILLEIKEMMTRMWQVDPRHAFRESNSSADYLAKNAASSRVGNQVLVVPLSDVASLLLAYSMGIFYPRLQFLSCFSVVPEKKTSKCQKNEIYIILTVTVDKVKITCQDQQRRLFSTDFIKPDVFWLYAMMCCPLGANFHDTLQCMEQHLSWRLLWIMFSDCTKSRIGKTIGR